jgi:ABC-type nickel/cobalt efflux system permease component RcnA
VLKGDDGIDDRGAAKVAPVAQTGSAWSAGNLEELLLHRDEGLWLLMAAAAFLGAAHALTPGHGKTLVAAYLVGERGTVGHALYLGLVTTLSHTGVVLAVALVVQLFFGGKAPPGLQVWLGLGGGLLVAGLGAWLLLARLAGRADHVHLFLLAFALPLLLAFSAGLAGVLVAIGIVVVKARGVVGQRFGESRAFRALPVVSAALVTCVGLWLCYHSLP